MTEHRIMPSTEVVLLGAGHSHLEVIKKFGELDEKPFRLTLVSQCCWGLYKGMLGRVLRKEIPQKQAIIDLGHLCQQNEVRFICQEVSSVDIFEKQIYTTESLLALHFDVASFDLGLSLAEPAENEFSEDSCLKPWPTDFFLKKLVDLEIQLRNNPCKISTLTVIGGDYFSAELTFSLQERFSRDKNLKKIKMQYVHTDPISSGQNPKAWKLLGKQFHKHGIKVFNTESVDNWDKASRVLTLHNGTQVSYDLLIPAYANQGHPLLQSCGLALDVRGLIRVNPNLESTSHPGIYATGSSVAWGFPFNISQRLSYQNKMGAVLFQNLQKRFQGLHQVQYHEPWRQPEFVYCGSGKTLYSSKKTAYCSKWWSKKRFKKDRKWFTRYFPRPKEFHPPTYLESGSQGVEPCFGTGDQFPRSFTSELSTEDSTQSSESMQYTSLASESPVRLSNHKSKPALYQTSEYQRCFTKDYYTFSRVFAEHCISFALAKGIKPTLAQSNITVQFGPAGAMKRDFSDLCAGTLDAMNTNSIRLAGGNAHAGVNTGMGLSLIALGDSSEDITGWNRETLPENADLIVTKPLGTGIVLAGYLNQILSSEHYFKSLRVMSQSHLAAFQILGKSNPVLVTGISGHGLAQTLLMLSEASDSVEVKLEMYRIPVYPGVVKALKKGVRSGLHSQNRIPFTRSLQPLDNQVRNKAEVLFDPQTAGPFLIGVPGGEGDTLVAKLVEAGYTSSAVIGSTLPVSDSTSPRITIS